MIRGSRVRGNKEILWFFIVLGITNSELFSSPQSLNRCNEERPSVGGMEAALLAPAADTVVLTILN